MSLTGHDRILQKYWRDDIKTRSAIFYVPIRIDGGDAEITADIKAQFQLPACTINSWLLISRESGSIVIDLWKDTVANAPPTDADSITNGHEPALSVAALASDTDLSDWTTTTVAEGDVFIANVDSCTTCELVTLILKCTRV